jgi:hypothetical protein
MRCRGLVCKEKQFRREIGSHSVKPPNGVRETATEQRSDSAISASASSAEINPCV